MPNNTEGTEVFFPPNLYCLEGYMATTIGGIKGLIVTDLAHYNTLLLTLNITHTLTTQNQQ